MVEYAVDRGFEGKSSLELGLVYMEGGYGTKRDTEKARTWFERAESAGNGSAANHLRIFRETHRDICAGAKYGNEKFAAEAKRRGLSEARCQNLR